VNARALRRDFTPSTLRPYKLLRERAGLAFVVGNDIGEDLGDEIKPRQSWLAAGPLSHGLYDVHPLPYPVVCPAE
jgi:hypothetical protein